MVASVVHSGPELRAAITIVLTDSTSTRIVFDIRTTGETVVNIIRGTEWISRARWLERELLIESDVRQAGGRMHFCDYWSLSDDGRRLTMEHRADDLDGQLTVFDRCEDSVVIPIRRA